MNGDVHRTSPLFPEVSAMIKDGLLNAARVLEDQAAGRVPDRARLLSGALALDALQWSGEADRDILGQVEDTCKTWSQGVDQPENSIELGT